MRRVRICLREVMQALGIFLLLMAEGMFGDDE